MAEKVKPAKLCFAIKANPFLLQAMDEEVERYEVCSPGEFHICVKNGVKMEKIVLSGVNKEYEDVRYAMERGVQHFTAESQQQFYLVNHCAEELDKQVQILLRVTSGNQFGMSEADVTELIQKRDEYPILPSGVFSILPEPRKSRSKKLPEKWHILRTSFRSWKRKKAL